MNKLKTYATIVTILLILILGFVAYNYVANISYNKGYTDGQVNIIQGISTTGNIPFFINQSGNLTITTQNIKDICGGQG